MNWNWIGEFASKHAEGLGLLTLAMAVTMRPKLPWPFNRVELFEWFYEWIRDGLLTFVSMRGPAQHSEAVVQESNIKQIVTEPSGKTTESVSSQITKETERSQESPKESHTA